jgi:xanthine dehydrogenase large subunit
MRKSKPSQSTASSSPNVSAPLHVTGQARFTCDEPKPRGLCSIKVLTSPIAHGRIASLDMSAAQRSPGVVAVLTARDIPGENQIGSKIPDEPLLPDSEVCYVGQPIAIVVGENERAASAGRDLIRVSFEEQAPILTITEAQQADSRLAKDLRIERGNVEAALAASEHILQGTMISGSQEHVYFETQRARALPGEDQEIVLFSATQAPTEVQEIAAKVLGLQRKDITVDVRRIGGGFGGKESLATLWACLAALACHVTRRPVEVKLTRTEDMSWTGKRHPFETNYVVGFDRTGRIQAYIADFHANGGAFADLTMPIIQRALLHADNAYYLPAARLTAHPWKTHVPPNTAFRGFGAPQGIFAIETVIERIARKLNKDPLDVRRINAYRTGQKTPYGQTVHEAAAVPLLDRLKTSTDYAQLRHEVDDFNRRHRHVRRGIGTVPVKFGISFTAPFLNQAAALVHLYTDGSVSVSHGGVEMGQGVNTKVAQVVAAELGVSVDRVRIESHNTKRTANTSPTAASTGADLNGNAARNAALQIVARLLPVAKDLLNAKLQRSANPILRDNDAFDERYPDVRIPLSELAHQAWLKRIDLGAHGFYKTPGLKFEWQRGRGTPFAYYVFGAALVVVDVDVLTGNVVLERVQIIHETAQSLNPDIDRGQIEGAFLQGFGWCTMEDVVRDEKGRCLTRNLTTYKIPAFGDLPRVWEIEMLTTARKQASVRGSKAIGEPPFIYGEAAFFAIQDALSSMNEAAVDIPLQHPATPESILTAIESLRSQKASHESVGLLSQNA